MLDNLTPQQSARLASLEEIRTCGFVGLTAEEQLEYAALFAKAAGGSDAR